MAITPKQMNSIGLCYTRQQKHLDAIKYYEKSLAVKPDARGPYHNIAYEYMYIIQFEKAKTYLDDLNKLEPEYFEYYYGMACWHALQKNKTDALNFLDLALQEGLPYNRIKSDPDVDFIRNTIQYKELVKKHFNKTIE